MIDVSLPWLPVILVILLGGVMQSTVGFAYALFATPLLVWIGLPLPATIVIVATCSCIQSAISAYRLASHIPWRWTAVAIMIRVAAMAVGVLGLKRLANLPLDDMRMTLGAILCLLLVIQVVLRVQPVSRIHPAWSGLAFISSGLLGGLVGMGGPPLVLWVMTQPWHNEKIRGFLFGVFMVSIPLQLVLLSIVFGADILRHVLTGLLLTPAVILGALIGLPIGNRMSRRTLRMIAYSILFIIGLTSMLPRLTHHLAQPENRGIPPTLDQP